MEVYICSHSHPAVTIDGMTDDKEPTADDLEQLAQSLAIDGTPVQVID